MGAKRIWIVQSLVTCFFWNAVLVGLLYVMAQMVIDRMPQWVHPFLQAGGAGLPDDARTAFSELGKFLTDTRDYLAPVMLGIGGVMTFVLWLSVMIQGRGLAERVQAAVENELSAPGPAKEKPASKPDKPVSAVPVEPPRRQRPVHDR